MTIEKDAIQEPGAPAPTPNGGDDDDDGGDDKKTDWMVPIAVASAVSGGIGAVAVIFVVKKRIGRI